MWIIPVPWAVVAVLLVGGLRKILVLGAIAIPAPTTSSALRMEVVSVIGTAIVSARVVFAVSRQCM